MAEAGFLQCMASRDPSSQASPGPRGQACSCLGGDHFGHHIPGVHVNGTDGHDLHPVASAEIPDEQRDERIQLADLRKGMAELGPWLAATTLGGPLGWMPGLWGVTENSPTPVCVDKFTSPCLPQ